MLPTLKINTVKDYENRTFKAIEKVLKERKEITLEKRRIGHQVLSLELLNSVKVCNRIIEQAKENITRELGILNAFNITFELEEVEEKGYVKIAFFEIVPEIS